MKLSIGRPVTVVGASGVLVHGLAVRRLRWWNLRPPCPEVPKMIPTRGTRITVLFGATFDHGVVVGGPTGTTPTTFGFQSWVIGYGRVNMAVFELSGNDEGVTWCPGLLFGWWPPHRRIRKAMRAAYAMDNGFGVHVFRTAIQQTWTNLIKDLPIRFPRRHR